MVAVIKGDMGNPLRCLQDHKGSRLVRNPSLRDSASGSFLMIFHNRVAALQLDSVKKQQATGRTGNPLQKEAG